MDVKENAIAELNVAIAAAAKLKITLVFQGNASAAAEVEERRQKLIREVEDLLAKAMEEWVTETEAITAELAADNKALEVAIQDIKKKIKTAERIVKAVEKLDGIIEKARKFIVNMPV